MTETEWNAIKNKDARYDGRFYYGLVTTNTVCRPSCVKRICNPKNVVIFYSLEDALEHGFKPCKRCHPDKKDWKGARAELAEHVRALIDANYKEKFSLDRIAGALYQNKSYILRTFKEETGYTPLEYHNYVRCKKSREMLENSKLSISYISDEVGFVSPAHYTRIFRKNFGCSPTGYRKRCRKQKQI